MEKETRLGLLKKIFWEDSMATKIQSVAFIIAAVIFIGCIISLIHNGYDFSTAIVKNNQPFLVEYHLYGGSFLSSNKKHGATVRIFVREPKRQKEILEQALKEIQRKKLDSITIIFECGPYVPN